ncbi:MAG: DASH family cryptochrome [Saprospiraceae bacterium]|nr:DASH family cryptochrome [Saprospiraceae bacterium]
MHQPKRSIIWFRQDLRIHDNEALCQALGNSEEVIPVFIFDPRTLLGKTNFGFQKTGKFRTRFILESVADLRDSLRALGSELYIRIGKPEEILFDIANTYKTSWVFCNRERTREEVDVQDALERKLWTIGQEMRYTRGKMLYYTSDLPFPITHTPDVFTQFRKEVERVVSVRMPMETPLAVPRLSSKMEAGDMPTLEDFGHEYFEWDSRATLSFKGGEREGLKRLQYYLWESNLAASYKETRNGMLGGDYSTKFSPWLAMGCLSPKLIYSELKAYEAEQGANESTYWIFVELLWRDFFRLMGKKYGDSIFLKGGTKGLTDSPLEEDWDRMQLWMTGQTGIPFIDANMKEINTTGFMSNRGRQNVASFLIKDLKVNWQMGAEYFESLLIDYDVMSNWGNWNYLAGVGSDPREDRYFNILNQARRYDSKGEYIKTWLPELAELPAEKIHIPDTLSTPEQENWHVILGNDYPNAIVRSEIWN